MNSWNSIQQQLLKNNNELLINIKFVKSHNNDYRERQYHSHEGQDRESMHNNTVNMM